MKDNDVTDLSPYMFWACVAQKWLVFQKRMNFCGACSNPLPRCHFEFFLSTYNVFIMNNIIVYCACTV